MSKSPGALRAKLESTGVITVKPGGLLEGQIQAQHLIVEEGGGLKAQLRIGPKSEVATEDEETAQPKALRPALAPNYKPPARRRDIPAASGR